MSFIPSAFKADVVAAEVVALALVAADVVVVAEMLIEDVVVEVVCISVVVEVGGRDTSLTSWKFKKMSNVINYYYVFKSFQTI